MLTGPTVPPPSGKTQQLVFFLHGYGADGHDLIGLAPYFQALLPDALCLAPHGPHPTDMGFGRQWFGLRRWQPGDPWPHDAWDEIISHGKMLLHFIADQCAQHGTTNYALVGFSQGTMMSLHIALRAAAPPRAVVGFSGALLQPEKLANDITARPPVILIHGDADPIVPFHEMAAAEKVLQNHQVPVECYPRPGLPHSIDDAGLARAAQFAARHFA